MTPTPPPLPHWVVAIDGPAASGKSSVARTLARRFGFTYVNTGAMYRAVTWLVIHHGVDPADPAAVATLLDKTAIQFGIADRGGHPESTIQLDGTDPTPFLCDPAVNAAVSTIAANPKVRQTLVAQQREYAHRSNLVMEGRDIGSVVFPETPLKFYIDASPEVRAQRRAAQGQQDDLVKRDTTDSSRKASPLMIAKDAQIIDTSFLTIDGVVDEIVRHLKSKGIRVAE